MYAVSDNYKISMKRPVQRHRIKGTIGTVPFTEEHILSGSFTISGQCSDNSMVQIGQVYTTELKITLLRKLGLYRYTVKGMEIAPHFGLFADRGEFEYIPLGIFTVTKASWGASGVAITAYDNMSKLDRSFTAKNLVGTPYNLLKLACNSCDLELNMKETDFRAFANGTRVLSLYGDNNIENWRDCVGWIAQTLACNVFADRKGRIYLRAYGQTPVDTIDTEHRFTGATFGDFETRYTGISVVNMEDQMTNYYAFDVDDGLTYNLGSNPFMQGEESQAMCREVLSAMGLIRYVPFSVDMIGNPAYDLMDVLKFEGGFADGEKVSCITKYTFHYNQKYSCSGVGSDPALATANSKSDKNISGLMGQISSITNSINRLIYDYNTGPLTVGQDEQTMGMLTYYISKNADVEGHFLMHYTASESTHLKLRFYDTDTEELFSPLEYDIPAGEGTIGVPHAYLNRQTGIHAVFVTAQVYSGELTVDTRGAFFTIDAGNFAEAVDDIAMDVRDITLRQLMESNGPDQIWLVGIEDGKMLVSKREYRDSYTANPKWEGVYTPGKALDAAIEFDGKWVLRANSYQYTLETEDQPWDFWIDTENQLIAQHGEVEDTRVILDTDVTSVSACRGYSSNLYLEQDQGLVVAYIKGGKPYYIQYVYDTGLEDKRWLRPELLMNEEVEDFRVHRLNDYRLGFELTTAARNIWIYTTRTYVAQAVPKESGSASLSDKSMFLYAPWDTDLSVEYSNVISEDKLTLYIYVSKPIRYFYSWQDILELDESSIEYSMIDNVEIVNVDSGAVITIHLKSEPKKLITTAVVNPTDSPALQAEIKDCGYIRAPKATLTFDTTIYRRVAVPTEKSIIRNSRTNFKYESVTERRARVREVPGAIRNTAAGIRYSGIHEIRNSTNHEAAIIRSTAAGMNYEQVAPSPI